jgi:hypothetical protein
MNVFVRSAMLATMVLAAGSMTEAASKKADAPGQDRTCLVTTKTAGSFKDTDVVSTKWLPRKAAEAQASKDPTMVSVFDYDQDPLVTNGTYASAEDLCNRHFD